MIATGKPTASALSERQSELTALLHERDAQPRERAELRPHDHRPDDQDRRVQEDARHRDQHRQHHERDEVPRELDVLRGARLDLLPDDGVGRRARSELLGAVGRLRELGCRCTPSRSSPPWGSRARAGLPRPRWRPRAPRRRGSRRHPAWIAAPSRKMTLQTDPYASRSSRAFTALVVRRDDPQVDHAPRLATVRDFHAAPELDFLMLSRRTALLLACAAALALPASAQAAGNLGVSIMDDQLLLDEQDQATVDRHMARFRSLGVDRLRVSAFWDQIAPRPGRRRKPNFDAGSPTAPQYHFANLDRVVQLGGAPRAEGDDLDHDPRAPLGHRRPGQARPPVEAQARRVRAVLAGDRVALQRADRPVRGAQRAQPAGVAPASERPQRPLRPAPLPPPRPRRVPRDPRRRPERDDPGGRAGLEREPQPRAELGHPPARVPARVRMRLAFVPQGPLRTLPRLPARARRRDRTPPVSVLRPPVAAVARTATTPRSATDAGSCASSTGSCGGAASGRPAAAGSTSTTPSSATRRTRPIRTRASR